MNFNKVILLGRLTQDPQLKNMPSGTPFCSFGLATNRFWVDRQTGERKKETDYHNIVLWRRLAEIASQYLNKGSLVLIEGRVRTRSWQDNSGERRYRTEIITDNLQLAPKSTQREEDLNDQKGVSRPAEQEIPIIEEGSPEVNGEEVPF